MATPITLPESLIRVATGRKTDPSAVLSRIFRKIDADRSGGISESEFIDVLVRIREKMAARNAAGPLADLSGEDVFNQLDIDGDGSLTEAELAGLRALVGRANPQLAAIHGGGDFRTLLESLEEGSSEGMDADGDGKVSLAELLAANRRAVLDDVLMQLGETTDFSI
jgi:Ca2+-binding EF-hand superfamily protein